MTTHNTETSLDQLQLRCVAVSRRTGKPCGSWPVRGSTVCRVHGGGAPQVRAAAARRVAIAEAHKVVARLGGVIGVDPLDALVEMVHEAAWNVAAYRLVIERYDVTVGLDGAVAVPEVRDGTGVQNAAQVHILVQAYDQERDRLVRYAKLCVDAGVDERRVRIAESQGQLLARVVQAAVDATNPTPQERRAAIKAGAEAMRELGAGE